VVVDDVIFLLTEQLKQATSKMKVVKRERCD